MNDKLFTLHVTKATGYLRIEFEDRGDLTDQETDVVMRAALKEFGNYSSFTGESQTRELHGFYVPGQTVAGAYVPQYVGFNPGENRTSTW